MCVCSKCMPRRQLFEFPRGVGQWARGVAVTHTVCIHLYKTRVLHGCIPAQAHANRDEDHSLNNVAAHFNVEIQKATDTHIMIMRQAVRRASRLCCNSVQSCNNVRCSRTYHNGIPALHSAACPQEAWAHAGPTLNNAVGRTLVAAQPSYVLTTRVSSALQHLPPPHPTAPTSRDIPPPCPPSHSHVWIQRIVRLPSAAPDASAVSSCSRCPHSAHPAPRTRRHMLHI